MKENPPKVEPPYENDEGLITVHHPEEGVTLPPHPNQIFAVVCFKGRQFRVVKDERILIENVTEDIQVGQQFVLNDVRMIGTYDYTCLGRPTVANARVFVTLEEKPQSEKVIIFKKTRRQGYQKSMGHRQVLSMLRVDRVEHEISEEGMLKLQEKGQLTTL
mmetsp:Transcript_5492/g.9318  ORF Transcript_5492/g.9318 Transcript_5492/m.9318 type:complete len:161 (+) Transcript_5492:342-824(+)